jgi:hypothetical protein
LKCRPIHFALIALLLGIPPLTARADDPATPTVKGNVSIQLPRGWPGAAAGQALISAVAPQTDKDNTGQFLAALTISQAAGGQINGAAQQAQLAKQYPTYRAIEPPAARVINGMQAVVFGGTLSANNVQLRTRQYMFGVNNQTYIITFTSLASRWAAYQAIVEASVGTFSVKK